MARRGWFLGAPWQAWMAGVAVLVLLLTRDGGQERAWWRWALIALAVAFLLWGLVVRATRRAD